MVHGLNLVFSFLRFVTMGAATASWTFAIYPTLAVLPFYTIRVFCRVYEGMIYEMHNEEDQIFRSFFQTIRSDGPEDVSRLVPVIAPVTFYIHTHTLSRLCICVDSYERNTSKSEFILS